MLFSVSTLGLGACTLDLHPPIVTVTPGTVSADWWYNGSNYYYLDSATGLFFYYGPGSEVIWMAPGWRPRADWHRAGRPEHFPFPGREHPFRDGWGRNGRR